MSDERLRERFQALREREAEAAPAFEHTLARARAGQAPARRRWLWMPAAAAVALLLAVLVFSPAPPQPAPLSPGTWAMPTDVLLEVPGSHLLRDVPAIGTGLERPPAPLETGWQRRFLG